MAAAAPTCPYATVAHGQFDYVGYTGVYNVVDYSAVSFPSGVTVDKERDRPGNHEPLSDICKTVHANCKSRCWVDKNMNPVADIN